MKPAGAFWRILDANLNRCREGLRVCEEVSRFVLEDRALTSRCQRLRYSLQKAASALPRKALLEQRQAARDIGHPARRKHAGRHGRWADLLAANLLRVQESLRVLEELERMKDLKKSRLFGRLRFRSYELEKAFAARGKSLRHR